MRLELDRKYVFVACYLSFLFEGSTLTIFSFRQILEKKRYAALMKWTEALESVHSAVVSKIGGSINRVPESLSPEAFGFRDQEGRWG
jgi:hypothetical protein